MLDKSLVFVDIDTQRDFLDPGGALFIAGSETIRSHLAQLTAFARAHRIPVLATACAHTLNERDPEPFPPHCLVGTPGQERVAETACTGGGCIVVGPEDSYAGPRPAHLTLQKRWYDLFRHPHASTILALYTSDRPTFVVYGVATDYCVKAAVLGLLDRGQNVAVVADAVRAVDAAGEAHVLSDCVRQGATLFLTERVCGC